MGTIQPDTHVIRSSDMSLGLRWKHECARWLSKSTVIFASLTFVFILLLYYTSSKTVTIVVDGAETQLHTTKHVLRQVLEDQGIALGEHDRISKPVQSALKDGDRIVIQYAKPIVVTADGQTQTYYSVGKTVGEVLRNINLSMGAEDKVVPPFDAEIAENAEIKVTRVARVTENVTEPLPFQVVKQHDPKLVKGKEETVQEGQDGILARKIEKIYEDGVLVAEHVLEEQVQTASIDKIVAVGTKQPVVVLSANSPAIDTATKNGVTFSYKQVLNNVTLTAYTAGSESTGKSEGHPQYGITYSGSRVTEGRTIAVDPKVIPIGWWVYIEGIGFRRAEDIGSGVKGHKIDVYFESLDYAKRFGLKRGYKVYIIGKEKPPGI